MRYRRQSVLVNVSLFMFIVYAYNLTAQQEGTIYDNDVNVTSFEEMRYPSMARQAHIQSTVVVRITLDDGGKVKSASAISGAKLLIPDSVSNANKWHFRPNANKSAVIIYEFRLADGRCNSETNHMFIFRAPNIASVIGCEETWQP
jgi:TonB family protein